jgi:hypothetical protein
MLTDPQLHLRNQLEIEAAQHSAVRNLPSYHRSPYDLKRALVYEGHVQVFVGQVPNGRGDVRTTVAALIRSITGIPIYFDGIGGSNNSMFLWVPNMSVDDFLAWSNRIRMRKPTEGKRRLEAMVLQDGEGAPDGFGKSMPFKLANH